MNRLICTYVHAYDGGVYCKMEQTVHGLHETVWPLHVGDSVKLYYWHAGSHYSVSSTCNEAWRCLL